MTPREICRAMFDAAVARAQPAVCLPPHFPPPPADGRLIVLGCGKSAAYMAEACERHYLQSGLIGPERLVGIAVTRHGHGRPLRRIRLVEAGHPVPDAAGLAGTADVLALAEQAGPDDLVLALISGGGSANWTAPAQGLAIADKQALTRALLRSGAPISDINIVRKHLSRIKGGRLAALIYPAPSLTLCISDVPGDDPSLVASGPTVPDPSTAADALAVLRRWKIETPAQVAAALSGPAGETPKPGDPVFSAAEFRMVARPADSLAAAAQIGRAAGYDVVELGDALEGEAAELGREHSAMAREARRLGRRVILLSGGELTVTVRGNGRGGPNQEYALALALAIDGTAGITALAADTDGADGGSGAADDPAGAFADSVTAERARNAGLNAAAFLANNDATGFFGITGDLLTTGPTGTNVNDFRCVVVDTENLDGINRSDSSLMSPGEKGEVMKLLRGGATAALLALLISPFLAAAASADLRVCNKTASRVGIAIGYKAERDWKTEGWWTVESDSCATLLVGPLLSRFYYMYAVDYDQGGEWGGNSAFLCTREKEFTIEGVNDCVARGYQRTGFYEVDTGNQESWTIQLTEPTSRGVGGR